MLAENYDLILADFQEYYNINIESEFNSSGYLRFNALLSGLPTKSRLMKEISPASSWSFRDETLSRILYEIDIFRTMYFNANCKNKSDRIKPDKQFEPKYVTEIKEQARQEEKDREMRLEHQKQLEAFFKARNPQTKSVF